jgi:ubiquinone/menaquinone biosynthesis C-methylase UbiE
MTETVEQNEILSTESIQPAVQQQVRDFYDRVGWKMVGENVYQNARYEDLRPVSQEYIHRCHLRVCKYLPEKGKLLLDAGSGPIQYPEYLEYSRNHQFRVCADISLTALKEARKRIGDHGLFVVCDVTHLPFKQDVFDGVVSLHTIHHVPETEQDKAYFELFRVLSPNNTAVVVNGWARSPFMDFFNPLVHLSDRLRNIGKRIQRKQPHREKQVRTNPNSQAGKQEKRKKDTEKSTFTRHITVEWLKTEVARYMTLEIRVWRSVNVRFLRALIHPWLGGKYWLRLLFWWEERRPEYFGEKGQYPLIVIRK